MKALMLGSSAHFFVFRIQQHPVFSLSALLMCLSLCFSSQSTLFSHVGIPVATSEDRAPCSRAQHCAVE